MIPIYQPSFVGREKEYVNDCLDSLWISSQGGYVKDLEASIAAYHDMPHALVVANCTCALHLAFVALGIGKGDEVICPDLTFIAPANMIKLTGAKPVLVDIDPVTLAINPDLITKSITPRTKAILVVHQFGHAADMDRIMSIARDFGLRVIEDNAESIGAFYKGKMLGTIGDCATFSFFGNKVVTTGEGGAIVLRDKTLLQRMQILRDHGMSPTQRYKHLDLGFNYRMTNLQAAIGLAQMEKLDETLELRRKQLAVYERVLSNIEELETRKFANWCVPTHWLMTVHLKESKKRNPVLKYMLDNGIECRPMINPVHMADHFAQHYDARLFPNAIDVSSRSLHLPSGNNVDEEMISCIAANLKKALKSDD